MDKSECALCGMEIDGGGLDHKNLMFCSAECVEEWDEDDVDDVDLDEIDGDAPLMNDYADFEDELPVDEDAIF